MLTRDDILNYALALPPEDRELVAVALQDSLEAERNPAGPVEDTDATDFLARADRLDRRGKTDTALDIVYDQVDEMLLAGRFEDVNNCLREIKTDSYSVHLLLALLTITLAAKRKLPDRAGFYVRAADTLRQRGELEEGLLVGLD